MTNSITIRKHDYNGVEVQQREDGYWNATAMCKANGREWRAYAQNESAKRFLEGLSRSIRIPDGPLVDQITDGPNDQRGTWVHRRIALHLAAWISDDFEQWVYAHVEELLTTGHTSLGRRPPTQCELILASAQALVDHERRLATVESRVAIIEADREAAAEQLEHVERSAEPAPDKSARARVNELVRLYCGKTQADFRDTWNKLYHELYYRCHFDAKTRAKNSDRSPLDCVEEAGLMVDLYRIASEVLVF